MEAPPYETDNKWQQFFRFLLRTVLYLNLFYLRLVFTSDLIEVVSRVVKSAYNQ